MNLDLTSERLLLRPLAAADLDIRLETRMDPAVMQYVGKTYTKDQVVDELPRVTRRGAGGRLGLWCVILRATGEKLGTALLLPLPIDQSERAWDLLTDEGFPDGEVEVGYILKRSAWGQGYATEVCRRLLRFAFEETPLEEVAAVIDPENTASHRVLEKSGLVAEGPRRAYATELVSFRITRQRWKLEGGESLSAC